jgi:hypothetical protein
VKCLVMSSPLSLRRFVAVSQLDSTLTIFDSVLMIQRQVKTWAARGSPQGGQGRSSRRSADLPPQAAKTRAVWCSELDRDALAIRAQVGDSLMRATEVTLRPPRSRPVR